MPDHSELQRNGTGAQARGQGDGRGDEGVTDPRQLVLPYVNTAPDLADGSFPFKVTPARLLLSLPALLAILAGLWWALQARPVWALGGLVAGVLLGFVAMTGIMTGSWAIYPHERVFDAIRHTRRRRSLPWSHADAVANAADGHEVQQVFEIDVEVGETTETFTGALTHDDTAVVPIRLRGDHTAFLRSGDLDTLAGSLTDGLGAEITPDGGPISFYATTRPYTSGAADAYEHRASNPSGTRLSPYLAGLLGDIGEWVRDRDEDTGANDTHHFLLVSTSMAGAWDDGGLRAAIPGLSASDDADGDADADDSDEPSAASEAVRRRVRQAWRVTHRAESFDGEPVGPRETLNLCGEYWERDPYPEGPVGEGQARAAVPCPDVSGLADDPPGETPAERALAPTWYAERPRYIEIGDEVARTFWISTWPEQPPAKFLTGLYSMPGVDLDIKVFGHPRPTESVVSTLRRVIPRIDAEGMDRAENMDVGSITIDDDLSAYILAFKLLQETNTQPWDISAYVTVRAPDPDTLDEACERVTKELRSHPARCTPAAPYGMQHEVFRSAAPFGGDHYADLGRARRRARKTHLALGGVFGALLPAATADEAIRQADGIRWGRETMTGRSVQIDPFSQGTAPHMITVGPSGSGKTFSVEQASQEWWLNGDDRAVIYCDTQGGFEDTVEALGAEHIVIDGKTGINPLDIRPAAAHDQAATDGSYNQYRLKVTEATEFFAEIIRSHGVDPARYYAIIEQAIEQTYAAAGITTDPSTHDQPSPTPSEMFDTLEEMMRHPNRFTFTEMDREAEPVEERVANLLNELSGFKEGGKYHNILTDVTDGLSPTEDMAYLDLRQLAGQTDGAKSVNLQLAVGQVSQLIKQTRGETVFVIDEAHNLLHSPEMVDWLNKAAREWRRYDACLWFVTQSPQEFLSRAGSGHGQESKRETIVEQCSVIQLMNAPNVNASTLEGFGVPPAHTNVVKDRLTPGSADVGYSECLISAERVRGWLRTEVRANPLHRESIEFTHRDGETYRKRMSRALAAADDLSDPAEAQGAAAWGSPPAAGAGGGIDPTAAADGGTGVSGDPSERGDR